MENKTLNKDIRFEGVVCLFCGSTSFSEIENRSTIWKCNGTINGEPCGHIICKCTHCERILSTKLFERRDNWGHPIWECKFCDAPQRELTEINRSLELTERAFARFFG